MGALLLNSWLALLLTVICSYLLGSVSSAIIVTKLFSRKDIRSFGSGNAGATNVLRSQGVLPAVFTVVGDLAKSMLAVCLGGWLLVNLQLNPVSADAGELLRYNTENLSLVGSYLAGIFCILGHLYPLYFQFRGGKGVMTTLGMTLLLDWRVAVLLLIVFGLVVAVSRMVSLGSIIAALLLPVATWIFRFYFYQQAWQTVLFCTLSASVISLIVLIKHRSNLKRIADGTENKL